MVSTRRIASGFANASQLNRQRAAHALFPIGRDLASISLRNFVQLRLASLVGQLGRGLGYLKPQVIRRLIDGAAYSHVATAAPRSEARQPSQKQPGHLVDHGVGFICVDQAPLFLSDTEANQFRPRPLKVGVRLTARRLLPLAPQIAQEGNAALIERKAVALTLDYALRFELADIGSAAIEVLR
jgi:hypothetical protein